MNLIFFSALFSIPLLTAPVLIGAQAIDLPTSKQLIGEAPGRPQRMNSLPISMAISPDHRYVVTVNIGYGTFESRYAQSLAVFDTQTGALKEFPDDRTIARLSKQTLFAGLAFSHDGKHIYASMASLTNPTGGSKNALGSGIAVYGFNDGVVTPERLIPYRWCNFRQTTRHCSSARRKATKGFRILRQLRCSVAQGRSNCWWRKIIPMT